MYYEDYDYGISEEDLKTDFHFALDELINAEVEKRLEERIEDITFLRERQKQYDEKIAEAQQKVKEADEKRYEAERARSKAERERDNTITQCKQSISDATQQKLDELFGDWLNERWVYYIKKEDSWLSCPYCHGGKVDIILPNGDKAVTKCKVCDGEGHKNCHRYDYAYIETSYPTFIKENGGKSIAPYFMSHGFYGGLTRVALRDALTYEEAKKKAEALTEESKQKALKYLEDRKKQLDKENQI